MPPPTKRFKKNKQRAGGIVPRKLAGGIVQAVTNMPPLPTLNTPSTTRPDIVDRTSGPCPAMGMDCGHKRLECKRHTCFQCADECHAIPPCAFEHPEVPGTLICGGCFDCFYSHSAVNGKGDKGKGKFSSLIQFVNRQICPLTFHCTLSKILLFTF